MGGMSTKNATTNRSRPLPLPEVCSMSVYRRAISDTGMSILCFLHTLTKYSMMQNERVISPCGLSWAGGMCNMTERAGG